MNTLEQRVAGVLRGSPYEYASDDSGADVVNSIYDLLQGAEADLHAAQARVETLKWQLAKAQEYQP